MVSRAGLGPGWFLGRIGPGTAGCPRFGCDGFPVPLRVIEVMMRPDKVIDREIVLPVEEPRAAPDDLLELDHRIGSAA